MSSRNIKIRSKILDDFFSVSKRDESTTKDCCTGIFSSSADDSNLRDVEPLNLSSLSNDKISVDESPKEFFEKYERESLEDNVSERVQDISGQEKEDTPKCRKFTDISKTWENIRSLDRIVQMLEMSSDNDSSTGKKRIPKPFLSSISSTRYTQQSFLVFFLLVAFFVLFSVLKLSYYILEFLKKYFEKGLVLNWSWMKRNFTSSSSQKGNFNSNGSLVEGERHLLTLLIISPILIVFLVSYTGLYILLLLHKVVLDAVPQSIHNKVNCRQWFDRLLPGF